MNKIELQANKAGGESRWTPLTRVKVQGSNREFWKCQCQCGTVRVIRADGVKSGRSKSCGCWNQEVRRTNGEKNRTHGLSGEKIYRSWSRMKARCQNSKDSHFKDYGARGIVVCDSWNTFENFLYDMGKTWFPGATIERKNVNGNYCLKNCCWVLQKEQGKNQRTNRMVTFHGKRVSLVSLCERFNVNRGLVYKRVWKGWDIERALTQPTERRGQ